MYALTVLLPSLEKIRKSEASVLFEVITNGFLVVPSRYSAILEGEKHSGSTACHCRLDGELTLDCQTSPFYQTS